MKLCWFRNIEQDFPLWDTSIHKISRDKYFTSLNKECQRYEKGHLEIRKMKIKDAKYSISFKGGSFNTLSFVDCYVQICNGTAVEHGSLLNCSGVCDGINCCKSPN
jgi:hypothetical protein